MSVENKNYLDDIFKDHENPKTHSFKIFGTAVTSFYYHKGLGWIRIFGRGVLWKDTSIRPLIFSERYGHTKGLYIGKWYMRILRKSVI